MRMYGFWRSQATFRVRVALNLKAIPYEEIPVDLDAGAQNEAAFLAINPLGGVPTLMVGEEGLSQSLAILEYLEEIHPAPPILPQDALGRARVRSLAAIVVSDAHPLIVPRVRRALAEMTGDDADRWKAWQQRFFGTALAGLERRLADHPATGAFCHGDTPGIADICLCGLVAGMKTFGIAVKGAPTAERIVARCMDMPAFEKARAIHQADYPG